jgi:DNA-binding NtrC family response regulator
VERKPSILVADVDVETKVLCSGIAHIVNCKLLIATSQEAALAVAKENEIAVALVDADTICDSLGLLRDLKQRSARIEVILADADATIPAAVEAIKAGATDYLEKPFRAETLEGIIVSAFERYRGFQVPTLDEMEKQAIDLALSHAEGNCVEAARLLSIGKTTLYRKLREYGDHSPRRRRNNAPSATQAN